MIGRIERQRTGSTPYILIDAQSGYIKFEGESFHENVVCFYKEIIEWLQDYLESDFKSLTFDCSLMYFNSSTAKLLLNMLLDMDKYAGNGKDITVNWFAKKNNDIIIECGEDFMEDMDNLKFNMVIN